MFAFAKIGLIAPVEQQLKLSLLDEVTTQRNLQLLMVEFLKTINSFATSIMADFFLFGNNSHDIWNFQIISNETKKTVWYGLEMMKYNTLIWATLPEKYKIATSLNSFKTKISTWKCKTCICQLC